MKSHTTNQTRTSHAKAAAKPAAKAATGTRAAADADTAKATSSVKSTDRDPAADHAQAKLDETRGGPPNPNTDAQKFAKDHADPNAPDAPDAETITQHKPTLGEAAAMGGAREVGDIGKGSVEETAPAVRGATVSTGEPDRVVQQGDEVVIFTRNPINSSLENKGFIQKVNQDGSVNVRVPLHNGAPAQNFTGVSNKNLGDGSPYWMFPAKPESGKSAKA